MRYFIFFVLFLPTLLLGQTDVPITLFQQFNGTFGFTIIGNTHNEFDNWQFPPPTCQMLTQSSANLNLSPTQNIVAAYLTWSGIGDGLTSAPSLNGTVMTADEILLSDSGTLGVFIYFSAIKNITNLIQSTGNGVYTFSNFDLNSIINLYCSNAIYFSGWNIIIVYEETTLPNLQLNVYNGFRLMYAPSGVPQIINFPIDNLNIVDNQNSSLTYIAWNGSPNLFFGESISINGNPLSNSLNPLDNPFNGTNSFTNSTNNWNMDVDTFDISPFISIGDTFATITASSAAPRYIQNIITVIPSELPDATVSIDIISGQELCNNRDLIVEYTVFNTNSNAVLPANVPVSIYADDVFLQTVFTPFSIPIDGSLSITQFVSIPTTIPNPFTLRVVVNDNGFPGIGGIPESNVNNNESIEVITLLLDTIPSVFSLPTLLCQNATVPGLPLVSDNGISGTWSPNVISNQSNGSYVFTPAAGQCAEVFTLNVTITPESVPVFALATSYCQNVTVPVLPLVSDNGISGTWSPNVISNQSNGSYVFTPAAGQCAISFTLNVTITPLTVPTFSLANSFCENATVPGLPVVSDNGISGTWSPPMISNQTSGSYVFTPAAGQCASSFTLNVTITPEPVPVFALATSYCQNVTVPVLPLLSDNGISGTWSPNVISNQSSGSYVFTPDVGQCASSFTLNVIITATGTIQMDVILCETPVGLSSEVLSTSLSSQTHVFEWFFMNQLLPATDASITINTPGIYQAIATSLFTGCVLVYQFDVIVLPPVSVQINTSPDFSATPFVDVIVSGGSGSFLYSFNQGPLQNQSFFYPSNDALDVLVQVIDTQGCYSELFTVNLLQYPAFFTPNGDGFNDRWGIQSSQEMRIDIFDRYGKLLYVMKNNETWDGMHNGRPVPSTDYWFVVYYEQKSFRGHFSLKR